MDICKTWKDFYGTTTIKKEREETIGSTNYFDVIQKNMDSQKYHCKEELDLKWDVKDNNYDYATLGNGDIDKTIENDIEYKKPISIGKEKRGIVKIENTDTGQAGIQGNLYIPKYIYKEELNLDWDEKDNNNYDVNHSTDKIRIEQVEKNKSTPILQNKKTQSKRKIKKIENPDSEKECPRCKKLLKNLNTLTKHMFYCGKEPHLQCDSCSYKAKYKNALIFHITRNHPRQIQISRKKKAAKKIGDKNNKARELSDKCLRFCMKCSISMDKPKLNKCSKCKSQLLYQCRKCNELFPTREKLTRHTIDRCDPKGYYHCPACDFKATIRQEVKFHVKRVHLIPGSHIDVEGIKWKKVEGRNNTPNSQLFTCPSCNKQFQRQASLGSHLRFCIKSQGVSKPSTHYVQRIDPGHKYMIMKYCRKCNTKYITEKGKVQKNECCGSMMSFKCLKCNRWYEHLVSIIAHVKNVCNLQSKHKCSMCDYEGSKRNLMCHLKSKHDLQSVECPKCKSKLKNKKRLSQHWSYCHREPLKCEDCPYKNKRKHELKLHIFKKHMN